MPVTSTYALTNATMPYVIRLANLGLRALLNDSGFLAGLNVYAGRVTYRAVADEQGLQASDPLELLVDVSAAA